MESVTFNVQGMSCGSCGNKVNGSIRKLEGIEDVQVNVVAGEVAVSFDEARVAVDQVVAAIESHGYAVVE
ncbi:cation transporter [Psychrobacillus sp.]|uniref:heavy-metal-associated domain-containing protein n=1 Tax=Psychrobacillus sp. TaxID=1871623 RepID=UPI0028BF2EBB|nr:cation transporter [Psychrobacillus sp.]